MTGEEWLREVFEPALEAGDMAAYPELVGAVRALAACGVLDEAQVAAAERRLAQRFGGGSTHDGWNATHRVTSPGSEGEVPYDVLEMVLSWPEPLADVDGVTVVIASVELWTAGVVVRLAGMRSPQTDQLDAAHRLETTHWAAGYAERGTAPPAQPGAVLIDSPLELSDDLATVYRSHARSAGGTGTEWRAEWHFEPGVPLEASLLRVAITGSAGEALGHDFELPDSRERLAWKSR